ncbi:gliding motility protein GldC [Hymenobacter guriensis]|uniref:Gliding motility protein GldC n=1 Tax=Hymenobacter guriensis TaxID=2793065 RepID=A0ABS0L4E7_9BACT|nr:gliding motility protein GldC [Hymenobacter guriensis]MBG8554967.1 gliding motility protein GldC [Hymenobacter guriensis]
MKDSVLTFSIALDENKMPETIGWHSSDGKASEQGIQQAKALNISVWDGQEQGTMKIGLWTKDMPVDQMKRFYVDTIGAIADSLMQATDDAAMGGKIHALCGQLLAHINGETPLTTDQ